MLLRIVDHYRDNPKRIDKLIAIKGLPESYFFVNGPHGKELKKPWEEDIDANIPLDIRNLCEPTYIVKRYPPIHANANEVIEKKQILGVKIDYNSEPGRQMWDDIEQYIEDSLPRGERIPVPVMCAKDERSAFDTYRPHRNQRGTLELTPAPVPFLDLTQYVEVKMEVKEKPVDVSTPVNVPSTPEPIKQELNQNNEFRCDECNYHHASQRGIRMHAMKRHPKKEKVNA